MAAGLSEEHWNLLCQVPVLASKEQSSPQTALLVSRSYENMMNSWVRSREDFAGNENNVQKLIMQDQNPVRQEDECASEGTQSLMSQKLWPLGEREVSDRLSFAPNEGDCLSGHRERMPTRAAGTLNNRIDTMIKNMEVSFNEPETPPTERVDPHIPPTERLVQELQSFTSKVQKGVEDSSRKVFDSLSSLIPIRSLQRRQKLHTLSALKQPGSSPLSRVHKVGL